MDVADTSGSTPTRTCSVVIVTYNSADVLRDCLRSVAAALGPHDEVIVVDNASADGTVRLVTTEFPDVRIVANVRNRGFAAAVNQGVSLAQGRLCLVLNPDTRVPAEVIRALADAIDRHGGKALVGPRLIDADGATQRSAFRFPTPSVLLLEQLNLRVPAPWLNADVRGMGSCVPVDWLKGACLLAPTALLRQFGPFDERFFMFSEDVDLCYRLQRAGVPVAYCQSVTVLHHGGMSTRHHPRRMTLAFVDSTYLFYRIHWPRRNLVLGSFALRFPAVLKVLRSLLRASIASARGNWPSALEQRDLAVTFFKIATRSTRVARDTARRRPGKAG